MVVVKRLVANIATGEPALADAFYGDFLGLRQVMDLGWIRTYAADGLAPPQVGIAVEGGSGTPVPDLSIEVDDVEAAYRRAGELGLRIEYDIRDEPWGVRRFQLRDPFGRLVNILAH